MRCPGLWYRDGWRWERVKNANVGQVRRGAVAIELKWNVPRGWAEQTYPCS